MAAQLTVVEGTTGPFYFQLLDQGTPVDLTDFTVTLLLTGSDGVAITTTSLVSVVSGANGVVSFTPSSSTLDATVSPIKARWKLTEDLGSINYIPTSYREEWDVVNA